MENAELTEKGRWIEPFLGSGVVGFNARRTNAEFSDLNPHIITFYNALKSSLITPNSVRRFLEYEGHKLSERGEAYYYRIRERFNKGKNPLDFLFLSRSCFNGVIRFNSRGYFNVPFCKKTNRFSKAYITKIVNQVQFAYEMIHTNNWNFRHCSFQELIAEAREEDFIYCDPPYLGRHTDYFNTWSEQDEVDLYASLTQTRAKFILSTWHSNKYRINTSISKYWRQFYIITKEHFYHIGAKEENRNSIFEALVLNYKPPISSAQELQAKQLVLLEPRAQYHIEKRLITH